MYGLNVSAVASTVQASVDGQVATKYRVGGDEVDIRVTLLKNNGKKVSDLKDIVISSASGYQIPLSEIAEIIIEESPSKISRDDQVRVVNVSSKIFGRDLQSVMKEIEKEIKK